jgi:hypothetical protein
MVFLPQCGSEGEKKELGSVLNLFHMLTDTVVLLAYVFLFILFYNISLISVVLQTT